MRISMLDNGMDSLRKGFEKYLNYVEIIKNKTDVAQEDYLILKQAVLSIHHGIEILLKCILYEKSEFLIIEELDNNYKSAYKEKTENRLDNVFQTSKASKIHTITYDEALSRVKYFIPNLLSPQLEEKLKELNTLRNALTHAEVSVNDTDINQVFDGLLIEVDILFVKSIGADYKAAYGYSTMKANYDKYMEYLTNHSMEAKKKALDVLLEAQEKTEVYASPEKVIYIDNFKVARQYLKCIQEEFHFGMDIYNNYCSGDTTVKIKDDGHVHFWTKDNVAEYIIKFKSMIITFPDIKSNQSPIIIFESDIDTVEDENIEFINYEDDDRILSGICIKGDTEKIIYNPKDISLFYSRCQYDDTFVEPDYYSIERFLDSKIFACLNFQKLSYRNFHTILRFARSMTGKELSKSLHAYL